VSGVLLDHRGKPIDMSAYKKQKPPQTGERFGNWAGRSLDLLSLPGGGIVQFDLGALTLTDYRAMRTHYQVNSSLSVLSFMQHQSNWTIDHDDSKVVDFMTENLSAVWTQLNRAMSQSNWAGFSPSVLQYENDPNSNSVVLTKIKDLIPEECAVNWKQVDGYAPPGEIPPKIKVYDGIKQLGWPHPIPKEATFWYPILMENGDYYGSKLLKSAYTSYFFSMLLHLFSNRYYERFGEPTPIGRAPQDEMVSLPDGQGGYTQMPAHEYMMYMLQQLRSRSVVVLPSDRDMETNGRGYFDYDLQYLESQMRGADFERYMQRLDEEISLAIFTPVLLMKTADVGSYNLGVGHMQMYLWMLNAINADRAQYINKYILAPLYMYNYPMKRGVKLPKIKFNKLDNGNAQMLQIILQALIARGDITFDLTQLGEMAGLTIEQTQQTLANPTGLKSTDNVDPDALGGDEPGTEADLGTPGILNLSSGVRNEIIARVTGQIERAYKDGEFNKDLQVNIGFRRKMERALMADGVRDAASGAYSMYARLDAWCRDMTAMGRAHTPDSAAFMKEFTGLLDYELGRLGRD